MIDERNEFGFPVIEGESLMKQILGVDLFSPSIYNTPTPQRLKFERAKQYAAEVRERNKPACDCEACRLNEMLPAVKQIAESWGRK
jgi:hypothetical protein